MKKRWLILFGFLILAAVTVVYLNRTTSSSDALDYVPADAIFIIKTNQPVEDWNTFSASDVWRTMDQAPIMSDLSDDAAYLDSMWEAHSKVFRYLDNRDLVISAHFTSDVCYDYLFTIDLVRKGEQLVAEGGLTRLLNQFGFEPTQMKTKLGNYVSVLDTDSIPLYLFATTDKLFCSYTSALIEQVMKNTLDSTSLQEQPKFTMLKTDEALLYVNLSAVSQWQQCYFSTPLLDQEALASIGQSARFDLRFNDQNRWNLAGTIRTDSSVSSMLQAVLSQPAQKTNIGTHLPLRTAWAATYTFQSFAELVQALETSLSEPKRAVYDALYEQGQAVLGASFVEDLDGWIGSSITACEIQTQHQFGTSSDYALFIQCPKPDIATDYLGDVMRKLKVAGIGKAKSIEYKQHVISYLGYNAFFKVILAGQFEQLNTPHFTVVGDYVVFSNAATTLVGILEDYEHGRTLDSHPGYADFTVDHSKSSIQAFVIPSNFSEALHSDLNPSSKAALTDNRALFDGIGISGFHLSKTSTATSLDWITNTLLIQHQSSTSTQIDSLYQAVAQERDFESDGFVLQWFKNGYFIKHFPGSNQVQIRAKTRNKVLDGKYIEYYASGQIKAEGKYKRGRKKGTWKYYAPNGDLTDKVNY